jgi:hypothetical protein
MFTKFNIDCQSDFNELANSVQFEDICRGRQGAVLVKCDENNQVPIVRTTSIYNNLAQKFLPIHDEIIEKIQKTYLSEFNNISFNNISFNNALIEVYDTRYKTMGYHSDQAIDLEEKSYIALYSCYSVPHKESDLRKLIIKNKITNKTEQIVMEYNSVIIFSTDTNQNYLHKIILDSNLKSNAKWFGITFRLSKTFIQFRNEIPYFSDSDEVLTLATEDEKKMFYKCRGKENRNIKYSYPKITFTISPSDTMPSA